MVRTVDLFREYPAAISTLFQTCFLSSDFEAEFIDRELQNALRSTPSLSWPRTTRPTITEWMFDANQVIPSSSTKGLWTRMKFYKIKESQSESQVKLTSVTETQKYWIYDLKQHRHCTASDAALRISDGHRIESHCLVLPQSSISKEPIFRIEVFLKMLPMASRRTKLEVSLKVECSVRAWGVSSWIEGFLSDSARRTYSNWLDYAGHRVAESMQSALTLSAGPMAAEPVADRNGLSATNLDRFSSTIESTADDDPTESREAVRRINDDVGASKQAVSAQLDSVRSSTSGQMSYGQMPLPPVDGRRSGHGQNGLNGEHHVVHIVEMGTDLMARRSSDECPEVPDPLHSPSRSVCP